MTGDDFRDEPADEPDDGYGDLKDAACRGCGARPGRVGAWGSVLPIFCSETCEREYYDDEPDDFDDDETED